MESISDDAEDASVSDSRIAAKWRTVVLAVLITALLLRIIAAIVIERHVRDAGRQFLIEGDANGYWMLAQKIAAGHDYSLYTPPRHVLRVPGFPLLLAGSIRLFGDSVFAARILLAVVGTACCGLTYLLGRRLVLRRVGFWAALLVAVNPLHVGNSVLILSETWFTFWMLLSLLALTALLESGRRTVAIDADSIAERQNSQRLWLKAILTGALIGGATMVRPGFLPWLIVCCGATAILLKQSAAERLITVGSLLVGCGLVLLPWAIRNYSVTGHWVATSLWSGPSLYDGLNPHATGASDMRFFDDENVLDAMSEFEMNQHYKDRAVEFATKHPLRVVELAARKAIRFLSPVPNTVSSNWVVWVLCAAGYAGFAVLLLVGMRAGMPNTVGWLVVMGPFVLFLLVHMVFIGSVRYRLPVEFPLSVLAAVGWRWLLTEKRR